MKATTFAEDPYYTPILKEFVGYNVRPPRSLERGFAIDAADDKPSAISGSIRMTRGAARNTPECAVY
jgi:hypothetical protein